MISPACISGLDLLDAMAAHAAERASIRLSGPVRLASCDSIDLADGFQPGEVTLESWPVRIEQAAVVIAVFAMTACEGREKRMAASGRFSFTALSLSHNPIAHADEPGRRARIGAF